MEVALYDAKPYDRTHLASPEVRWKYFDFHLTKETAVTAKGTQAVCAFVNDVVDRPCLEILAGLGVKLVVLRCAGYNNVDLDAAKALGIVVTRVPAYSPNAVAEHTVGLLLAINRKIHKAFNRVRDFNFTLNGLTGFDLYQKTAGIVGGGKIGKIVGQILKGFGMRVLVYDIQHEIGMDEGMEYCDFQTLLRSSNVVSLHIPLTPETFHIFNAETFAQMKRGAFLINTSRGKIIETTSLIQALKQGQLGGVALDVYEEEEGIFFEDLSGGILRDDELARLLTFPNVLITAHQAYLTEEALQEIARTTTANLLALRDGTNYLPGTVL
ncbi:MAG: 2-hydroxyacid dehydrogenase [Parachlamydia sp.]|nr:2-hydroxyacid dehydrogenase [Parachlamydia sp.]